MKMVVKNVKVISNCLTKRRNSGGVPSVHLCIIVLYIFYITLRTTGTCMIEHYCCTVQRYGTRVVRNSTAIIKYDNEKKLNTGPLNRYKSHPDPSLI